MKTLVTKQTVKLVSTISLSLVVFGTALFAQPSFELKGDVNEEELAIQEWMTSYEAFTYNYTSENYSEEALEVQDWMTDLSQFNSDLSEEYTEEALPIQDWMVNYSSFVNEDEEPLLAIEDWMLDYSAFVEETNDLEYLLADAEEEPLEIEAWMTNQSAFDTAPATLIASVECINLDETEPVLVALHVVK